MTFRLSYMSRLAAFSYAWSGVPHEVSSWYVHIYCSVLIEGRIMDYNCQLWRIGMIHVRVLGILYQKRAQAPGWTNYSFSFLSQ